MMQPLLAIICYSAPPPLWIAIASRPLGRYNATPESLNTTTVGYNATPAGCSQSFSAAPDSWRPARGCIMASHSWLLNNANPQNQTDRSGEIGKVSLGLDMSRILSTSTKGVGNSKISKHIPACLTLIRNRTRPGSWACLIQDWTFPGLQGTSNQGLNMSRILMRRAEVGWR